MIEAKRADAWLEVSNSPFRKCLGWCVRVFAKDVWLLNSRRKMYERINDAASDHANDQIGVERIPKSCRLLERDSPDRLIVGLTETTRLSEFTLVAQVD